MFEMIRCFILSFKQSSWIRPYPMKIAGIVLVVVLSIGLCSCSRKPTTIDMQNIHTVQLHVNQSYTNVEEEFTLPVKEMLSELFKVMDVKVVVEDELADAVLTINLKGRPRKATFNNPKRTYYEAAKVNGSAGLTIEGFSSIKVGLYGAKHYHSTNYYSHSNSDPKIPLMWASQRASVKMFIDLWGPPALLPIWHTSYANVLNKDIHDLDEIIKDKDAPAVVPVIMKALQSDYSLVRWQAIPMLDELTRTKKFSVKGKRQPRIVKMSSDMREAVLKDLMPIINIVNRDVDLKDINLFGKDIIEKPRITAMHILGRIGHEANVALPVLRESLNSDNENIRGAALNAFGAIAPAEESVPILIDALQSESRLVRTFALSTLGDIGSDAKETIPLIIPFLANDKSISSNASFAEKALEKITGQKFGRSPEKWQEWWEKQ
jgi:hypothetical protein